MAKDREQIENEFNELVNMTPKQLTDWLETEESKSVGQKDGGGESVGHASGRRIVQLQRKKRGDYGEDDFDQMNRVTGYIKRHLAQKPEHDIKESNWRYSLMNWGHDPCKDGGC